MGLQVLDNTCCPLVIEGSNPWHCFIVTCIYLPTLVGTLKPTSFSFAVCAGDHQHNVLCCHDCEGRYEGEMYHCTPASYICRKYCGGVDSVGVWILWGCGFCGGVDSVGVWILWGCLMFVFKLTVAPHPLILTMKHGWHPTKNLIFRCFDYLVSYSFDNCEHGHFSRQ